MVGPTGTLTFTCSICAEPSHDICVYCTKDVCRLHRCQRCLRCSDCCECESPLCLDEEPVAPAVEEPVEVAVESAVDESPVEPLAETVESETTEPDQPSLDEHLPDTSPNGSW
jgi:hypothetical protein